MSIPSPEQPITRPRPAQIAESVKSMQSQGLIEGGADGAAQPPPEQMTPERYAQIKRLAFRVVAQADRGLTARRTA